ncbi:MAG: protoporphyrinogen oxidase [Gemmatimonadota bacterium]
MTVRVGVVGAGIAGLAAGWRLARLGHDVTVFERDAEPGGVIRTIRDGGWLVETGPNTITHLPLAARDALADLGLAEERIPANPAARARFVVRDGRLMALPLSPSELLASALLSAGAKLRLAREPFITPSPDGVDESVADFTRRRLGQEVLEYLVDPLVSGLLAGDPERLSVQFALPRLARLEREYGSVIKGLGRRRAGGDGAFESGLWSFREGLAALPRRLAHQLGDRLKLETPVTEIGRLGAGWRIRTRRGDEGAFDAVVVAAPAWSLAGLLAGIGPDAAALEEIRYAPVAVVALGFRRNEVGHPLDGFGFLAPAVERRRVLGALFSSTLFPGRAPDGHVLLTAFVGGERNVELLDRPDHQLVQLVTEELMELLDCSGAPVFSRVIRRPRAIPQYVVGYRRIRECVRALEERWPGLALAGSFRDGVSVGETLASGLDAASRVDRMSGAGFTARNRR